MSLKQALLTVLLSATPQYKGLRALSAVSSSGYVKKIPVDPVLANRTETGGLSGAPIKPITLTALRILRSRLPSNIPIIGCGGISSGDDAIEYAKAGASLVQVYTHFGYDGVGACRRIKDEIVERLEKEGMSWGEVVGKAVEEKSWKKPKVEEKKEGTVGQLISEAEELKKLLDQLGERMAKEVKPADDIVAAAVQPVL